MGRDRILRKPLAWMGAGLVAALCAAAPPALGERDEAPRARDADEARRPAFGERTGRLLELQRSGRLAAPPAQRLSGEVQTRIYRRYVESFSHPIPDTYIEMGFGE
ncbi:DUF3613 domain-containing protein [Halomonas koreensis]|uniref:DUF3613 domain-containing protein n=1 Tax=Halomonas koreensis TaxID=245385 RepID=A0ABU1G299_9GAMM|nr:DUF3613 domain-containing protein [Halomonas koreensis]MDR5867050.1 DUF3613 domain-containing protein [Halomonas koreensis]